MGSDSRIVRALPLCVLAAALSLPLAARADEEPTASTPVVEDYYSDLEDLSLRRSISVVSHDYFLAGDDAGQGSGSYESYVEDGGGSAGGYINIGSPATGTFLASTIAEREDGFLDRIDFGVDWRPEVSGSADRGHRQRTRELAGSDFERIGVRADVTALLHGDEGDYSTTAWRVSGMLGSASVSLAQDGRDIAGEAAGSDNGLLWDVGVGWSSGAISLNAGYQSLFSLYDEGQAPVSIAVLSLGADYSILPGLSVYGEFNVIDDPLEESDYGLGAALILGTGVSF